MRDRALRVVEECARIAEMTEEPGRITRRFLSPPMREVHRHLRDRMRLLGMSVDVDAAGNLHGNWSPNKTSAKRLMVGSHLDSVPNAGAYDGVLGVVVALEWVRLAAEMNLAIPIEVIGFSEEEGVRFGVPFIGSRAMAGSFDRSLLALRDTDGVTLEMAIREFGLDPNFIEQAATDEDVLGFVEVHIEQGPLLEAEHLSVAAIAGIVGQTRAVATFVGRSNHAGTTPMHLRHDALTAAAEWIAAVETVARDTDGLVATTGRIVAAPNAVNVIAGSVEVSLDCRHVDDAVRESTVDELRTRAQDIASRRGIAVQWRELVNQGAVQMDSRLTACMTEAIRDAGFPPKRMTSGAGHDAMIVAARVPSTMLFLRSPGGVSHDPSESVLVEDVEASIHVAKKFLERLAASVS